MRVYIVHGRHLAGRRLLEGLVAVAGHEEHEDGRDRTDGSGGQHQPGPARRGGLGEEEIGREDRDARQGEQINAQSHLSAIALQREPRERRAHKDESHPVIQGQAPAPHQADHREDYDGPGERGPRVQHELVHRRAAPNPARDTAGHVGAEVAEAAEHTGQVARPEGDRGEADPGREDHAEEHGQSAEPASPDEHQAGARGDHEEGRELMAFRRKDEDHDDQRQEGSTLKAGGGAGRQVALDGPGEQRGPAPGALRRVVRPRTARLQLQHTARSRRPERFTRRRSPASVLATGLSWTGWLR